MNILIPTETTPDGESALKVTSDIIKLSEVSQGRHVGLIPVKMKGSNSEFERLYRVEIAGEASDNGKGYRRVMLKVTIPYHRIWTADPAAAETLREKQESASAGSISMHVVLSIPGKVRQDLLESGDAAATYGAEGHLTLVGALLSALTEQIRKPTLLATTARDESAPFEAATNIADTVVNEEGVATMNLDDGAYWRLNSGSQPLASVMSYDSTRFGTVGLSLTSGERPNNLSTNPRDPLVRGLFGLVPIEENTSIVAGPTLVTLSPEG